MRAAILLIATVAASWAAGAEAAQLGRLSDAEVCDAVRLHYNRAGAIYESTNSMDVGSSDIRLEMLRQLMLNNLLLNQLAGLTIMRWYNCDLPQSPLPSLPMANLDVFVAEAESQVLPDKSAGLSEARLRSNRTRVLGLLRESAMISAVPAACAGSAAFARKEVNRVFDALYAAGYGTDDVDYFRSQYDQAFEDQYAVTKGTIGQDGYDTVCGGDMVAETSRAFEKLGRIRDLLR